VPDTRGGVRRRFYAQEFSGDELQGLLSSRFARVTVMGIAGNEAMKRPRIRASCASPPDLEARPLGLRYRLPEGLMLRVRRLLMRATGGPPADSTGTALTLDDVRLLEGDVREAIHLLAVVER
jgi:hypothetical protein